MKRVINKVSRATVAETVARLIAAVEARGMKLLTTIDHSGEAGAARLEWCETKLVVFARPRTGAPSMQAAPLAGLDSAPEGAGPRRSRPYGRRTDGEPFGLRARGLKTRVA